MYAEGDGPVSGVACFSIQKNEILPKLQKKGGPNTRDLTKQKTKNIEDQPAFAVARCLSGIGPKKGKTLPKPGRQKRRKQNNSKKNRKKTSNTPPLFKRGENAHRSKKKKK